MATNFLQAAGTNGFIVTPFNLLSTEMNALTVATGTCTSSVGGTSGKFSQTNFGNAIWGYIWFIAGASFTPTAGAYLAGWWLNSTDGGTTFESGFSSTLGLPRTPDFAIPLNAAAGTPLAFATGRVLLPAPSCKVVLLNASGATLPTSGNLLLCGPTAIQY